jgi:hypothetical protein
VSAHHSTDCAVSIDSLIGRDDDLPRSQAVDLQQSDDALCALACTASYDDDACLVSRLPRLEGLNNNNCRF